MKVAILHYHLNPGGVTQVIGNHLRALSAAGHDLDQVLLIHGGRTAGWQSAGSRVEQPLALAKVVGLEYDDARSTTIRPDELAAEIEDTLSRHDCRTDETVLHVHNHALGKCAALPLALDRLARRGYCQLLQIHDFAEDFRPHNYHHLSAILRDGPQPFPGVLYPQANHVHYAVLNRRDLNILQAASVARQQLHYLPNPVIGVEPDADAPQRSATLAQLELPADARLVVYPVRGIRRKNVGEMLLLAALARPDTFFAITLAPKNPREATSFEKWRGLAEQLRLRCRFDIGGQWRVPFAAGVAAADALLTTSVAEGFGMGLLEAWLAERPLIGRDLPEITADFLAAGVQFPCLRDSLRVPSEWVGRESIITALANTYRRAALDYQRPLADERHAREEIETLFAGTTIDFARLTTAQQATVIKRVTQSTDARAEIHSHNPHLSRMLTMNVAQARATIESNRAAVHATYCPAAVGRQLGGIYADVLAARRTTAIGPLADADRILDEFLHIRRLHPLRLEK